MELSRTCPECGEDWPAALHNASGLCRNHAVLCGVSDEKHRKILAHCPICGRENVPAQWHHVAGERQYPRLGKDICLNCHGIITHRQSTGWDPSWKTEAHPVRCIAQGMYDLFWLWWQRSGVHVWRTQLAELVHVAWLALLALTEQWGLRGWDVSI
jgi:hypothetical protein